MEWKNKNFLKGTSKNFKLNTKIGLFDLDGTLITTKTNNKFPKDKDDWKFLPGVKEKLRDLYKENISIIIITNQGGIKTKKQNINEWEQKIESIQEKLKIPLKIYCSIDKNSKYHKPIPTFYDLIKKKIEIKDIFYVGDSIGRKNDYSDVDIKFAYNCNIKFYVREKYFENIDIDIPKINYPIKFIEDKPYDIFEFDKNEKYLIILTGIQASGKSFYVKNILKEFERINQDELGSKLKCINKCKELIEKDKNIVIDNTNVDKKTRAEYIKIAKNYKIWSIYIKCEDIIIKHNMLYRLYKEGKYIPQIAYNIFKKKLEIPEEKEGFHKILQINFRYQKNKDWEKYLI